MLQQVPSNLRIAEIYSELASLSARRAELESALAQALREVATEPPAPPAASDYLSPREAAALLNMSLRQLEYLRSRRIGPKFVRIGKVIRYRRSELDALTSAQT